MEEKKLLKELTERVQQLNDTIAKARAKNYIVTLHDNTCAGNVNEPALQVIISKPVCDTNQA